MIHIVTDTASDITSSQAAAQNVELVSIGVAFGGVPYNQNEDENFGLFYNLLAGEKELPTTSQPSPAVFHELFARIKNQGDEAVVILLSSKLSGTLQSALIAKEMADYEGIYVVDSGQAVFGQRMLVDMAVALRKDGVPATEIADAVQEASGRIKLFAALDTLKYLRKGGRIPKSTELIGAVMGIKPIIQIKDGAIVMAGKARGNAGAVTSMVKLVEGSPDFDTTLPVYFGYSGSEQSGRNFRKILTAKFRLKNTLCYPVGPIVGTHVGPGAFAVGYLTKPAAGGTEVD